MAILVTGATGRIGRHFVEALLKKGENVRILARDVDKASALFGNKVEIFCGDVTDVESVKRAVKDCSVVYHLAALVSYESSREEMFLVNVEGTRNVLDAAEGKRIICMSSAAVYGKHAYGTAESTLITEDSPLASTDLYGETKAAADALARQAGAIVLRPSYVYGASMGPGLHSLFGLIRKGRMVIGGAGRNRIQWSHMDDVVSALLLAGKNGNRGEAYNIESDDVKTQEELLGVLSCLLGAKPPKIHVPLFLLDILGPLLAKKSFIKTFVSDRVYDCSKAKNDLCWKPIVTFEQGFREPVAEYLRKSSRV